MSSECLTANAVPDLVTAVEPVAAGLPVASITTFLVAPQHEDAFVEQGVFLVATASQAAGVNAFALHRAVDAASPYVEYALYEDWQTRAAFDATWQSRCAHSFHERIRGWLAAPPQQRLYVGWLDLGSRPPVQSS